MSRLSPAPPIPIRDDPTQDAIWKRWFNQLQSNMGGLGGFSSGAVIFADAGGNPTSDTAFSFNSSTNVLTVNGSTFGTNTQIGGTLGVTGNTTLTGDLSVQGNTTLGNAATDIVTATAGVVVTGAGAGTARSDTGIEIQRATNSGISLYSTNTGGTTNESFMWLGAKDGSNNISKQASVSSKWAVATSGSAIGVLRLNAIYQSVGPVSNDDVAIRLFGNTGVAIFGSSDTTGPGSKILSVQGKLALAASGATIDSTRLVNFVGATEAVIRSVRSDNTRLAAFEFLTGATQDWFFGLRDTTDSDFHIYSFGTSADALSIARATGQITVSATLNLSADLSLSSTTGVITIGSGVSTTVLKQEGATPQTYLNSTRDMYFNADSDNTGSGNKFEWAIDRSANSGGTVLATLTEGTGMVLSSDIAINGGDITSTATTFNLLNATVTTLNIGAGASTAINIGNASGANTVAGRVILNHSLARAIPVTETNATHTVATTTSYLIANRAGTITVTLPTASSFVGRELFVKTIQAQQVDSNASNVIPLAGGAAGTTIVPNTAGKWALLQSNGTNWEIMASN